MSNATRILLWTDTPEPFLKAIDAAGLGGRVRVEALSRKDQPSEEQCAEVEALFAMAAPAGLLPRMKKLRWVQAATAGVEGWLAMPDLPANLALTCARGTHKESMPENIIGAIMHIAKPFGAIEEDQKSHKWTRRVFSPLNGRTLGILGLGAIGQEVARIASAVGMRVIGTKRTATPLSHVAEVFAPERTNEVLAQSDFVLLLLPATPATDNFMDAARFAHMKPGAWLLNFGRGHIIKDDDLIAAVTEKKIAGAILDVFRQEPLPAEHKFWGTPGITVLPHIGGPQPNRDEVVARLLTENISRFVNNQPLRELVDRAAGY